MNIIKELLANQWYAAIAVFFTQIFMLYFRIVNIFHTTKLNMFGALWSNNANAIMWLISMTIGMNSMLHGQVIPVIAYMLGGTIGTWWGIKKEIRYRK